MPNALQQMAEQYLTRLYELSEGGLKPQIDVRRAVSEVGFSSEEMRSVHSYLESKDLISWKCPVGFVRLTPRAIDAMQNSYEAKETLVLKKIYDLSDQNTSKPVFFPVLEPAVGMGWQELSGFLKGLEERGFVEWPGGEVIHITRDGIDAIDSLGKSERQSGGNVYNTHINEVHGTAHIGPGGSHNTQINNQPISEIIPHLAALIEAVKAQDFDDKDEVVADLEKVQSLAQGEINEGTWKRIQTKLTAAKTTMEITGLAYKSLPYWPMIWDYFMK